VTKRGNLVVAIDRSLRPAGVAYLRELSVRNGQLALRGDLATRHSDVLRAELVLVGRTTGARFTALAQVDLDEDLTNRRFGLRHSALRAALDIAGMDLAELAANEVLDAWLEIDTQDSDTPHRIRIGRTPYLVRRTLQAGWRTRGDKTVAITPYFTFRAKRVSFHVDVLGTDGFELLQDRTRRVARLQERPNPRPVWIVGERPYKAQDTGLAFFRYMRERHPEIDTYYVIDRSSPEVKNLAGLDNILWYQSKEHIDRALVADRFIGSHHPEYLYPTWLPQFRRAVTGTKVFLQHGVMGTKWLVPMYGKHAPGFSTDLFLVSSEREKEYIVSDFGYAPDEVVVTGLSRFDTLFANDVPVRRNQILIIPTWREWLQDPASFEESEYLQQWRAVLFDPRLRAIADSHGSEVIFCLHPNMQQYRTHFEDAGVTLISQGEVEVQHLLKQSAVMMTDYSSVGFDFSFLGKPVIYFQFDRDRFLGRSGSHLDLDNELPGPVGFTADAVMGYLVEVLDGGGLMTAEYASKADQFVAHRDRRNCDRIFSAVKVARPSRNTPRLDPELRQLAEARFRRSRAYFPMMKRLFNLWRRLPMDQELLVFESGVGRQYADSPRYIYEELVRRGDTRTKVWAYSGKLPVTDPHTITVKRLSPEYYWYLARAKYWVNNQSFPHYLNRRPDGIYIQTWHGTPLKRMQHDLDEVHGRDPDYLARVTAAMQQWSVLLSPSPYATRAFRSAFRYQGPVLELGYPRNDVLADPERRAHIRKSVRRRLGFGADTKVVLYAPTFRDDLRGAREGRFRFELPFDLEDFASSLDENTVLLLRMHVLVENNIVIPQEVRHRVVDVSSYPEIQELFLASDVLVTDYSSVFFDYAILRRPVVFYAYDVEHYREQLRGFYLDYENEAPGPIVETAPALWCTLRRALDPSPEDLSRLEAFAALYAPIADGFSARRIVDELL
jgi:CDP-glycerol glycerophosphotransferase